MDLTAFSEGFGQAVRSIAREGAKLKDFWALEIRQSI